MTRRHRILMTLRIIALILVGLAFLIARLAKAQEISAAFAAPLTLGQSANRP